MAWVYLAPTQIGGSASYVVTGGISMAPRFHTGDLAIVRPAGSYHVGDVVAYHSTLLHVVVLHRIIGRSGNAYILKGDDNRFDDPTKPVRSQFVGKLWLHIPHGGVLLRWLHTPLTAALAVVAFGLLSLLGAGETRRQGRRRRATATGPASQRAQPMKTIEQPHRRAVRPTAVLTASGVVAVLFLGLAAIAFSRPTSKSSRIQTPYTQQVSFAYAAHARASDVYPTGDLSTGDPIFLALVRRVRFDVGYGFSSPAPHDLAGTEQVFLAVTGPTGWSRSLPLGPLRRFRGTGVRTQVTVDLPSARSLVDRVQQLTGVPAAAGYALAIAPEVHLYGTLAGHALDTAYTPTLSFQLTPSQLQLRGSSGQGSGSLTPSGFTRSQAGSVSTTAIMTNSVVTLGHALSVSALRWTALLGLLLAAALAVMAAALARLAPSDEAARIQAEYGHLIVPIVLGPEGLGARLVDVPTITTLVRLAECGQRLIMHSRDERCHTYLLTDEGTVYRYRADPGNTVWGEWSTTAPRPLAHAVAPPHGPAVAPMPATAATAPSPAGIAPEVYPPPAFLTSPVGGSATEIRAPQATDGARATAPPATAAHAPTTPPAPTAAAPHPMESRPEPKPSRAARPRLRRWAESQAHRVRLVRELGSAFMGTSER